MSAIRNSAIGSVKVDGVLSEQQVAAAIAILVSRRQKYGCVNCSTRQPAESLELRTRSGQFLGLIPRDAETNYAYDGWQLPTPSEHI